MLKRNEEIAEADTLLLTVPNQLGIDDNAHVIEAILKHVAPGMGWQWGVDAGGNDAGVEATLF